MSLRFRFILFVALIHIILFSVALWILQHNKFLFVAIELLLILTLVWSVYIYRTFLKPLNLIAAGVETIRDRDFQTKFLPTGQSDLDELIDVYNRMIDQLRSERTRQREQHYFLERLIHATPSGVLILDLDNKVSLVNPAAAGVLRSSADKLLGQDGDRLPGPCGAALRQIEPGETRVISLSGLETYRVRKSHFLDHGFHRHFLLIESLTDEIIDSQKRAYTSVIRMMSHEVNNTVGAVNSILQSCLGYSGQLNDSDREELETAFDVATRRNCGLSDFMTRLASVVRVPEPVMQRCDLVEVLNSVEVLLAHECEQRGITWRTRFEARHFPVQADTHQLEQAILNIARNALEAIDSDGTLTIKASPQLHTLKHN